MLRRIIRTMILIMVLFSSNLVFAAVTQVDLTGLATGADVNHQHVYVDSFDGTYHFKRCFICGGTINKAAHTMVRTDYAYGYQSCYPANSYTVYCSANCGYSYVTSDPHPGRSDWVCDPSSKVHYKYCTSCSGWLEAQSCYLSNGSNVTCTNLGTCAVCNYTYTSENIKHYGNGGLTCAACGTQFFSNPSSSLTYSNNRRNATLTISISSVNGAELTSSVSAWHNGGANSFSLSTSTTGSATQKTYTFNFTLNTSYQRVIDYRPEVYLNIGGKSCLFYFPSSCWYNIWYDATAPTISSVSQRNIETSGAWCISKEITVTGTDNASESVYVKMTDRNGNTVYPYSHTTTSNGSFTFKFIPDVEANERTLFYIYAKDNIGNESRTEVYLEKMDRRYPTLYNDSGSVSTELSYLSPWRQNQLVTFKVKDAGIGQVQIGFNNTNDYQTATYNSSTGYYERQYNFYGNVPTQVTGALYVKDGLGNEKMYKVNFNKLDNTNPTISASNKTYGEDITATIGDTYAGVTGHQITSSNSQPSTWISDSSESSKTVNFGIKNVGTWYLWVKDGAGNVNSTSMSVSKRSITITANNQTTYYPTRITKTTAYATSSYLPSEQSISAITLTDNPGGTSYPTPNANGIGTGTITPSAATITSPTDGNVTGNYTITYANGTWTVKDNTKPTGRIKITNPVILKDGKQAVGNSATNVTIIATDDYAKVKEIYLFNENNITTPVGNIPAASWINWETSTLLTNVGTNTKTMNWTLSNGDGVKTVYLYIKDRAGNVSVTF